MRLRTFIIIATLACCSAAHAQQDRPRLAVDFQGPVGKTRALGFLPGRRFYAAGEGKVLELFEMQDNGVSLPGPGRWEFARGARGGINDVAVTVDGTMALIGGLSARGGRDIILMELATRTVLGTLPVSPISAPDSNAHSFTPILSLAVSPDADYAASSSLNGEVWLWDLRKGVRQATGRMIRSGDKIVSYYNPVAFAGKHTLLYSVRTPGNGSAFKAVALDPETGRNSYLSGDFDSEICGISVSADGRRIVIADNSLNIAVLTEGVGSAAAEYSLSTAGIIRNVVISPDGELIAVMGDDKELTGSYLSLMSVESGQIIDTVNFPQRESCTTAAFSADGKQLLSHDDSREVLLKWDLQDDTGKVSESPLSEPPVAVAGRGLQFLEARFLSERSDELSGYHIQIVSNDGPRQFSLTDGALGAVEEASSVSGSTFAGGWKIRFLTDNSVVSRVELISPQQAVHTIAISIPQQGELTKSYCFIPDSTGKPAAVALGTRSVDGIYVYGLNGLPVSAAGTDNLLRYFRDHNGEISDLSVSSDGRFLLSASRDKTIRVWSLEGLFAPGRESLYGAEISLNNGAVTVGNLLSQGIFFGRKIRTNDRIVRVASVKSVPAGVTDPLRILEFLQSQSPFEEMYVWTDRLGATFRPGGDDDRIVMVPGWEPLMTLVVDKSDEWVLFTPEGYYNASAAEGHRLFGWQFNMGRDQTPRYEPAGNLQKQFEKPGMMKDILRLGSVASALTAAGQPVPDDLQAELSRGIQSLPLISITSPADNAEVLPDQEFLLRAEIRFPAGVSPEDFKVSATIGARSLGTVVGIAANGLMTFEWRVRPVAEINPLRVSVRENNGSITTSLASDRLVTVHTQKPPLLPSVPRLYVLAFGAEQYQFQQKLEFSVDDAAGVFESLKNHKELFREFSALSQLRTNSDVRKEILAKDVDSVLSDVRRRQNPEDLILIFVTGHGVLGPGADGTKELFYYLPPHVDNNRSDQLQREGIAWGDFASLVNDAPCHVIWCIDACHAGAASEAAKKSLNRDSAGTERRCVFLSTSEANELARENQVAIVKETDAGHGWFAMAFLETLIGSEVAPDAAENVQKLKLDGSLRTDEIGRYVARRVKEATNSNQRPVFTPKSVEPATVTGQPITLLGQQR